MANHKQTAAQRHTPHFPISTMAADMPKLKIVPLMNGGEYAGYALGTVRSGVGVSALSSGTVYRGNHAHSKYDGFGVITYTDGKRFRGEWSRGVKHGFAVYEEAGGCEEEEETVRGWFAGQYVDGVRQGYGTHFNAIADETYDGQWANGKRSGLGVMSYGPRSGGYDRCQYMGEWTDNARHGRGRWVFSTGRTEDTVWHHGIDTEAPCNIDDIIDAVNAAANNAKFLASEARTEAGQADLGAYLPMCGIST